MVAMVFVLLNIGLCNGGKTSPYVRKLYASEDLPKDTFPSPPGYNAPEQVLSSTFFRVLLLFFHVFFSNQKGSSYIEMFSIRSHIFYLKSTDCLYFSTQDYLF